MQHFTGSGSLTSDSDKNGNSLVYSYHTAAPHPLATIRDTQGRIVTMNYDATMTYITGFKDNTNRGPEYHYDTSNRLSSTSDAEGKSTYYGYTGSDLTTITDPNTNVTQITMTPATGLARSSPQIRARPPLPTTVATRW